MRFRSDQSDLKTMISKQAFLEERTGIVKTKDAYEEMMRNYVRLHMQVNEAQPGCPALTMLSASTLKAPTGWNNLGAGVLLGCGPKPGMLKLWQGSRRGSTHSLFFGTFAHRALLSKAS